VSSPVLTIVVILHNKRAFEQTREVNQQVLWRFYRVSDLFGGNRG